MREIKFRMIIGKDVSKPATLNQLILAHALSNRQFPEDGSVILSQYTGLKDKNGKEIYEGDLIKKFRNDDMGYQQSLDLMEVVYVIHEINYTAGFELHYIKTLDDFKNKDPFNLEGMIEMDKQTEVNGNIWENAELLKL